MAIFSATKPAEMNPFYIGADTGYRPGLSIQSNRFESDAQRWLYRHLVKNYKGRV